MSRNTLSVWNQRIVGVVNAAPSGISTDLVVHLTGRMNCLAATDMSRIEVLTQLGRLRNNKVVTEEDGYWYPTGKADVALTATLRPPHTSHLTTHLTVDEVAAIHGVTPRRVRYWCQAGQLPATKVRFPEYRLLRWGVLREDAERFVPRPTGVHLTPRNASPLTN